MTPVQIVLSDIVDWLPTLLALAVVAWCAVLWRIR